MGLTLMELKRLPRLFFNKSAKDLTLGEAAILAALPQAPSYYSPYGNNQKELFDRQKLVLKRMLDLGFITQEEYDAALAEKSNSLIAPKKSMLLIL